MTKAPRVLILAHRFWPTITDNTLRLVHWIERLNRAGIETRVVTARSGTEWSGRIQFDRTVVDRISSYVGNPFRAHRYIRDVQACLTTAAPALDVVYVDNLDAESAQIISKWKPPQRPPVIVRYDHAALGRGQSSGWQPPRAVLDVCRRATAIIAPCAESHKSLLAQGIIHTPILRIDDWQGRCIDRSVGARRAARGMLSSINHDLYLRATDLLVVCPGELSRSWGVELVAQAMKRILETHRRVKLWILGDGPERAATYEFLEQLDLHRVVAMPGIFTDLEQVLQVADLCIFPARAEGLSWLAPTCAASNLPMLLADSPAARRFCPDDPSVMLFNDGCAADLHFRIEAWLRNPTPLVRAALGLQRLTLAHQEQSREISELMALLRPQEAPASFAGG